MMVGFGQSGHGGSGAVTKSGLLPGAGENAGEYQRIHGRGGEYPEKSTGSRRIREIMIFIGAEHFWF